MTIEAVTEPDTDGDLAGDRSEDRTNLRTTMTQRRLARPPEYAITIENAGPRVADLPQLSGDVLPHIGSGTFGAGCQCGA